MDAWLKLHRKSIESRVFSDPNIWRLWCWCLIKSNWKRGWYSGRELQPGQFAIGREAASEELGVSGSAWYRGMQKLQEFGCIRMEANNRFTIVSIANWDKYQGDLNNKRTTGEQQADNKRTTGEQLADTIEEGEEVLEVKESKKPPPKRDYSIGFDKWWVLYPKKVAKGAALSSYQKAIKDISASKKIEVDRAAELLYEWTQPRMREIATREQKYQPNPATWLNHRRYEDVPSEPAISSLCATGTEALPHGDIGPVVKLYDEDV